MAKKNILEDIFFPLSKNISLTETTQLDINGSLVKTIVQKTLQGAYQKTMPSLPGSWSPDYGKKPKPVLSEAQVELVIGLIQSLQPRDAIEVALASQFIISYISGLEAAPKYGKYTLHMFEFGHKVLDALHKYRSKGTQQINVNYNVNQGQINNIKIADNENL